MTDTITTTETSGAKHAPRIRVGTIVAASILSLSAFALLSHRLGQERHFADESAMIAQSYYSVLFASGQWNHPDWLHYAAYDHPPFPKYMFGSFLRLAGQPVPSSLQPWLIWMSGDFSPPRNARVLYWSRVPSAIFGAVGVVALFACGVLIRGRIFGLLAALALLSSPLYFTHARRAMSDSFSECFVILSVLIGLWGMRELWRHDVRWRRWLVFVAAASLCCGCAALAKLNGGIATVIVQALLVTGWLAAWAGWSTQQKDDIQSSATRSGRAWATRGISFAMVPIIAAAVGLGAFGVFVGLNPFMTARPRTVAALNAESRALAELGPVARARFLVDFRRDWSREALESDAFAHDKLVSFRDKLRMTVWDGFGRYSLLGPRDIRTVTLPGFDRDGSRSLDQSELPGWLRNEMARLDQNGDELLQDDEISVLSGAPRVTDYRRAASFVWFPLVMWGFVCAFGHGWWRVREGDWPASWGLNVYAIIAAVSVVALIPLNWDRYYLPIQPVGALLASYGVLSVLQWIGSRLTLKPPEPKAIDRAQASAAVDQGLNSTKEIVEANS